MTKMMEGLVMMDVEKRVRESDEVTIVVYVCGVG